MAQQRHQGRELFCDCDRVGAEFFNPGQHKETVSVTCRNCVEGIGGGVPCSVGGPPFNLAKSAGEMRRPAPPLARTVYAGSVTV